MKKIILEKNFQPLAPSSQTLPNTSHSYGSNNNGNFNSSTTTTTINSTVNGSPNNGPRQGVTPSQLGPTSTTNPINNHSESGFQPYRAPVTSNSTPSSLEDALLSGNQPNTSPDNSVASQGSSPSTLPTHILPYTERLRSAAVAAGFTYNPFIAPPTHPGAPQPPPPPPPPPPHHGLSSHIPAPAPPPPTTYRLDDPIYLERYGIIRQGSSIHQVPNVPVITHGDLSPVHTTTNSSSVPSYQLSSRYSELLATHQERVLNEERQRLLGHAANSHSSNPINSGFKTVNSNSLTNSSNENDGRREFANGVTIIQGTPRDLNAVTTNCNKKPNGSIVVPIPPSMGVKPLNLTANTGVKNNVILVDLKKDTISTGHPLPINSCNNASLLTLSTSTPIITTTNSVSSHLWRPQISERDDVRINSRISQSPDNVKRHNPTESPIDYSYSKKQKINSLIKDEDLRINHDIKNNSTFLITASDPTHQPHQNQSHQLLQIHQPHPYHLQNHQQTQQQHHFQNLKHSPCNETATTTSDCLFHPDQSEIKEPQLQRSTNDLENRVISKLDLQEIKLKAKRLESANRASASGLVDSSEDELSCSEDESEEEIENSESKGKMKIIITKGPPLKLDASPQKLEFLTSLGLITHKAKQEFEFEKFVKRRRSRPSLGIPRLLSSDVPKTNSFDLETKFLPPSDILPSTLNSPEIEPKLEEKKNYMSILGLELEHNVDKIKECELVWEGVLQERERRRSINLCFGKLMNNLTKETLEKWLNYLSQQSQLNHKNGFIENTSSELTSSASHSWQPQKRMMMTDYNGAKFGIRSGLSKINNEKEFAQKFHKKVLLDTALKQKDDRGCKSSKKAEPVQPEVNLRNGKEDKDIEGCSNTNSGSFKWPGIEAIIESYERYSIESQQEKEFLTERLQHLKLSIQEKEAQASELSKKIASLSHSKKELDEECDKYKRLLENIKRNLEQMVH